MLFIIAGAAVVLLGVILLTALTLWGLLAIYIETRDLWRDRR